MDLTPVQKMLAGCVVAVILVHGLWQSVPDPDPTYRFLCPNFDSVRVVSQHWIPEHRRVLRTIPATCGDTSAVTFGYLR